MAYKLANFLLPDQQQKSVHSSNSQQRWGLERKQQSQLRQLSLDPLRANQKALLHEDLFIMKYKLTLEEARYKTPQIDCFLG